MSNCVITVKNVHSKSLLICHGWVLAGNFDKLWPRSAFNSLVVSYSPHNREYKKTTTIL